MKTLQIALIVLAFALAAPFQRDASAQIQPFSWMPFEEGDACLFFHMDMANFERTPAFASLAPLLNGADSLWLSEVFTHPDPSIQSQVEAWNASFPGEIKRVSGAVAFEAILDESVGEDQSLIGVVSGNIDAPRLFQELSAANMSTFPMHQNLGIIGSAETLEFFTMPDPNSLLVSYRLTNVQMAINALRNTSPNALGTANPVAPILNNLGDTVFMTAVALNETQNNEIRKFVSSPEFQMMAALPGVSQTAAELQYMSGFAVSVLGGNRPRFRVTLNMLSTDAAGRLDQAIGGLMGTGLTMVASQKAMMQQSGLPPEMTQDLDTIENTLRAVRHTFRNNVTFVEFDLTPEMIKSIAELLQESLPELQRMRESVGRPPTSRPSRY